MVVQKRVGKEAGLTARHGTLQWGVELIMGRGTLPRGTEPYQWGEDQNFARNPTMVCGTLSWGTKHYDRAWNITMGCGTFWGAEPYHEAWNTTMGRGTLPWSVEHYHGTWNTTMGYGTLLWGAEPTNGHVTLPWGAEPYHWTFNTTMGRGTQPLDM